MTVVNLSEFKNRQTILVMEHLLARAKRGEVSGFLFSIQIGEKQHSMGVCGGYLDDPTTGVAVASRMWRQLNTIVDQEQTGRISPGAH